VLSRVEALDLSRATISANTMAIPNKITMNPIMVVGPGISEKIRAASNAAPIGSPRTAEDTTYAGTFVNR
jgi:hypothetical protein